MMYVDDFDAVAGRVTQHSGCVLHGPAKTAAGGRMAVFEDPDGNPIEVVETIRASGLRGDG